MIRKEYQKVPSLSILGVLFVVIRFQGIFTQCTAPTQCIKDLHHVCNGEHSFLYCNKPGDIPVEGNLYCPQGSYCVHSPEICSTREPPACESKCSICDKGKNIACISKTQFAFCLRDEVNYSLNRTCPKNQVCALGINGICSNSNMYLCEKDKPEKPTPPTNLPSKDEVIKRCNAAQKIGKFATNDCKKYIYCFIRAGGFSGNVYPCPGDTLFNCKTQQCDTICNNSCPERV
ncbi:uncharacterized protein LOC129606597 [Condylostylus longicornis]|uniref:uncharacterized protein LOC129606597 n=1 Tax=Condylostylus longicornis TaxID=2530218 RepID=UPI00244E2C91|nr:uncharacterized protein LOC129606597 [Condylostylus longicornis]